MKDSILFIFPIILLSVSLPQEGEAIERLNKIQTDIQNIETRYLNPVLLERANKITANISNGQLLFFMRDYERAAIVLLDTVEMRSARSNPGYPDALYFLAESLYQIRNYKASSEYFTKIIDQSASKHKEKAITRILEIALITKDNSIAEQYLAKSKRTIANMNQNDELLYAIGKYHYRIGKINSSVREFSQVSPNSNFYLRSQYFLGVIKVRKSDLVAASEFFNRIIQSKPKVPDERFVIEESKLALARIEYENNALDKATSLYAMISRDSSVFEQGLYESVWISIKQKDFEKALRKLEVQIISQPDVIRGPDARLLQGKLFMMLKRYNQATESFQEVLFEFGSIQSEMNLLIKKANGDLAAYFNKVIGKKIEHFDLISFLPDKAAEFAGKDVESDKALLIINTLAAQKRDIDEAKRTIQKIETALSSENRIKIFPKLYEGSIRNIEAKSNLINYLEDQNDSLFKKYNPSDPEIIKLRGDRLALGEQYKSTPQSSDDLKKRESHVNEELFRLDQEAFKINLEIRSIEAQLTAIKKYIDDISKQTVMSKKNIKIKNNAASEMDELLKLKTELILLSEEIESEKIRTGIKDKASSFDINIKNKYFSILIQEFTWLSRNHSVSNSTRKINLIQNLDRKISSIDKKMNKLVDEGIIDIHNSLKSEKQKISLYRKDLNKFKLKMELLGGSIAAKNFNYVKSLIDQIILEADVGLIDIAWKEKEDQTAQITRILGKQRAELESLELNMREVNNE